MPEASFSIFESISKMEHSWLLSTTLLARNDGFKLLTHFRKVSTGRWVMVMHRTHINLQKRDGREKGEKEGVVNNKKVHRTLFPFLPSFLLPFRCLQAKPKEKEDDDERKKERESKWKEEIGVRDLHISSSSDELWSGNQETEGWIQSRVSTD